MSFVGGTILGAGAWHAAQRLSTPPRPKEGLGDLLGWAFVIGEGIVLMKDGSFLAGMTLQGRDLESASPEEVGRAARTVQEAMVLLGSGYTMEVNAHRQERQEYPRGDGHFPTEALRSVEAERRAQFMRPGEHYETQNTVLITYTPPREQLRRWEKVVVSGTQSRMDYSHILNRFQSTLGEVLSHLSTAFTVAQMDTTTLLTECHRCLTGRTETVATQSSYLSHTLASSDAEPGFVPRIAEQHTFVLTITSLGPYTQAAAGDFFNAWRDEARWHMRFTMLGRTEAQRRIRRLQTRWFHQRGGLRALAASKVKEEDEDQDAVAMQDETARAHADVTSGRALFGCFTNAFVLRDKSLKRGRVRAGALLQALRDQGFTCMLESVNATDAFIGSLPGHGGCNLRRPLMSSRNVAHLFPTTTPWAGHSTCPSTLFPADSPPLLYARARGASLFRLNIHQGDVGHTLVVGATGAGKSVLVGFMAMSFLRYARSRVFLFDIGRSHEVMTAACGGTHHNLGRSDARALQPLRHLDTAEDVMWAMSWLEAILDLAGAEVTPKGRIGLGYALDLLAERPKDQRTLTALHLCLPREYQDAIEPYTVKGAFGQLVDGSGDARGQARFTTFELQDVVALGDSIVVPMLLALFRSIERSLDGTPTLIVIEEAWAALMRSTFADRIRQWLLTLRKRNAAVIIVAHSVGQIRSLPNVANITESCPTRILLPNPEARVAEHAAVYRFLDLNAREIDIIASAQRRRDYYYQSPSGNRLFELNLGPRARALLMPLPGHTAQESARVMKEHMQRHGADFLEHIDPLDP